MKALDGLRDPFEASSLKNTKVSIFNQINTALKYFFGINLDCDNFFSYYTYNKSFCKAFRKKV